MVNYTYRFKATKDVQREAWRVYCRLYNNMPSGIELREIPIGMNSPDRVFGTISGVPISTKEPPYLGVLTIKFNSNEPGQVGITCEKATGLTIKDIRRVLAIQR